MVYWLVVWNMDCTCPYIGNVIIPIDELMFFRGVQYGSNHQPEDSMICRSQHISSWYDLGVSGYWAIPQKLLNPFGK